MATAGWKMENGGNGEMDGKPVSPSRLQGASCWPMGPCWPGLPSGFARLRLASFSRSLHSGPLVDAESWLRPKFHRWRKPMLACAAVSCHSRRLLSGPAIHCGGSFHRLLPRIYLGSPRRFTCQPAILHSLIHNLSPTCLPSCVWAPLLLKHSRPAAATSRLCEKSVAALPPFALLPSSPSPHTHPPSSSSESSYLVSISRNTGDSGGQKLHAT